MLYQSLFALAISASCFGALQKPMAIPTHSLAKVLTPQIQQRIENIIKSENIPGMTVGVVWRDSGEIEMQGFGISTEDEDPVTPDTLFFIGSCSKAFLTTSLGLLMDDYKHGRNTTPLPNHMSSFDWSTKIKDLLPGGVWRLSDPWATDKASLGDILSHVSGLYNHDNSYTNDSTPLTVVQNLRYLKPKYEFRESYDYNNLMFITGGHIMDTYAKGGFIRFVTERIFKPLGMNATTYSTSQAEASGLLSQGWGEGRRIPNTLTIETEQMIAGAGGIISNTRDMTRWIQVLMSSGVHPITNEVVIPTHIIKEVTAPRSIIPSVRSRKELTPALYGMGWTSDAYQGHKRVWHTGGLPGFLTWTGYYPDDNLGIFIAYNTASTFEPVMNVPLLLTEAALGLEESTAYTDSSPAKPVNSLSVTETPALDSYVGRYYSWGYWWLNLCDLQSTTGPSWCDTIRETFATVNITHGLAASWDRVWFKHLSITLIGKEICLEDPGVHNTIFAKFYQDSGANKTSRCIQPARVNPLTIYPAGYGKDKSPFTISRETQYAAFIKMDEMVVGLGLLDGVDENIFDGPHSLDDTYEHEYASFIHFF